MICPAWSSTWGQVLVAVPEGATPAQVATLQAKAERALARVRGGEDFARVAREMSDAPGAANTGGQMGLRPVDRYPQLFINAVQALPDGGVSGVVRSGAGFHVLKVIEKRQAGMPGINVTQSRARHILPAPRPPSSASRQRASGWRTFASASFAGTADFAQLARENSQDASARNGGDLGWANPGLFRARV
jgi:peptidyl-prolyl cis-trans isomerase SurA